MSNTGKRSNIHVDGRLKGGQRNGIKQYLKKSGGLCSNLDMSFWQA